MDYTSVTTAWLLSAGHQTFHLWHHETQNMTEMIQDCLAARIPHQTRMEQHSSPAAGLLSSQMLTDWC